MTEEIAQAISTSAFAPLGLVQPLLRALLDEGYVTPTPVQSEVIPPALAARDVIAGAQTGTGKTAGFVLPMLQRLAAEPSNGPRPIRALILTPTRELAGQIADSISHYGRYMKVRHTVVYGGVSQYRQEMALKASPDILVATPGRLLDLMQQRLVDLRSVSIYVLDEADRMLDMGFIHDVRRITQTIPRARQTLLFSATVPPAIEQLARDFLVDPVRIAITPAVTTAEGVEQSVMFVTKAEKRFALEKLLSDTDVARAIVFTRTKHGANRLSEQLDRAGIGSAAIHGNKSQSARERALEAFRKGETRVLVATDVAARGIDVDNISHVINYDLPNVAEAYVHRIGRTGRAGRMGRAISFCDAAERGLLRDIERLIKKRIPVVTPAS
jgi:ATP-dependent RNA helicase RhlE